jgi:hypothetical protein
MAGYRGGKGGLGKVERLLRKVEPILRSVETREEGMSKPCLLYQQDLYHQHKKNKNWDWDRKQEKAYLRVEVGRNQKTGKLIWERVHRLVCYKVHGSPPPGKHVVRHLCCNPGGRCLRSSHMVWGSAAQNAKDARLLMRRREAGCLEDMIPCLPDHSLF